MGTHERVSKLMFWILFAAEGPMAFNKTQCTTNSIICYFIFPYICFPFQRNPYVVTQKCGSCEIMWQHGHKEMNLQSRQLKVSSHHATVQRMHQLLLRRFINLLVTRFQPVDERTDQSLTQSAHHLLPNTQSQWQLKGNE